ncbi:ribonuclease HII [Fibrobacterota bacterium]
MKANPKSTGSKNNAVFRNGHIQQRDPSLIPPEQAYNSEFKIQNSKLDYNRLWQHDICLRKKFPVLAGVDEAGRGPLAGNVVAACTVLDLNNPIPEVNDSKKIPEKRREKLFTIIKEKAVFYGIGECSPAEIDEYNILQASLTAMKRAVADAGCSPDLVLVDGNRSIPSLDVPQRCLIKGDGLSASIAAASILAKVTRDRQMLELHSQYPEYGFNTNKGYGSQKHIEAIRHHGLTPAHRRSFRPVSLRQLNIFSSSEESESVEQGERSGE